MHAKPINVSKPGRAETAFREAFERLKQGKPIRLPKGTRVSQNNVAKEAGLDPSALKKARFPALVAEFQRWIDEQGEGPPPSDRQTEIEGRQRARGLRQQLEALKLQRNSALGMLVEADARILELTIENDRLRTLNIPSVVSEIRGGQRKE